MDRNHLERHTSISTVIAEFIKQLRLYGADFVRSGGDISLVDPNSESQESVAKALKITKAAYSKIENGDVAISIYHLSQLCVGYGISLGEFMSCVDKRIRELESEGINVINIKLLLRLDCIRWQAKVEEKTEASFNKGIRELRKNKTYSLLTEKDLENLKQDCRKESRKELEKKYDLGEAISQQDFGMV